MSAAFREVLIWGLFVMTPFFIGVIVAHICLTAPARRNERARLFLDLLETGLQNGQSPERTITSISETRDRTVTVHFHLLAAHIEEGLKLEHALVLTPRLLPRGVAEVVKIGAAENALPRLLPAARAMLADVNSRMRGAVNYVVLMAVVVVPAVFFFLPILSIFIWPKLKQILADMEAPMPRLTTFVFDHFGLATMAQFVVLGAMLALTFFYVAGPRATRWTRFLFDGIPDRLALMLPWRRRRAQRDFTGVLAVLLDAGLEERRAVELAARASANDVFERRAQRVIAKLREGIALPEALKTIESDGEFQWRWTNALRSSKGFFAALRGWHEALEARAFQQEQAAAHAITSGIVVLNGAMVGLIAAAVFLILISLIEEGTLW